MKVGFRKPSIKKSISARTTGKVKRKVKRLTNPFYGKKGVGFIKNPKKALYNKVYSKTTISTKKSMGCLVACIWYPMYWCFILSWWVIKYTCLAMWWLCVLTINACLAVFEWIININATESVEE